MPKADPSVALAQKALELCDDCEPGDVDCEETCVEKTLALKSGATTVRKMAAGMPAPSGVMVALRMPKTVADAIAIPGGEKAEDLHVTVAYIPKIGADEAKRMLIQEALAPLAQTLAPIKGCIGGIGVFNASESSGNRRVFYATFSSPGLEKLRAAVLDALAKVGVEPANKHGFVPHITLKYLDEKEGIPGQPVAMPDFPVDGLCIGWAEGAVELELNGVVVLKAGEPVKLDLGCGDARAPGHIGIDLAPQDEATLMHDLEAGIPMPDASVDEIRAHDLLHHMADPEHLSRTPWALRHPSRRPLFRRDRHDRTPRLRDVRHLDLRHHPPVSDAVLLDRVRAAGRGVERRPRFDRAGAGPECG
jgi:2'-5' RNA ligase